MKLLIRLFLCLFIFFNSCKQNNQLETDINGIIRDIQKTYAPDKRVAIFNVSINFIRDTIVISGKTNLAEASKKLTDSLHFLNITIKNNIRILPDTAVGKNKYAIARNSVINIRSNPNHSAELGTQSLLGTPLKIYDKKGDFYQVQTPDNYISWVDKGGIATITKENFDKWNSSEKIIFTQNFGYVYKNQNCLISIADISLGGTLQLLDETKDCYRVAFPDQRVGFLKKEETQVHSKWITNLNPSPRNIEVIAKQMVGFPYLWGGTSAKGLDCSGFVKMVYLMNGFITPRDASQQILIGKTIDKNLNFSNLQKGDLIFFGKKATKTKKQKVTHVGIWLGNKKMEFIHSSGNVHINSMDSLQNNFDRFNKSRYLGARRYLNNF